jgi:transcriptional regulator with XRE-family HTH domain
VPADEPLFTSPLTPHRMARLLAAYMYDHDITQAELARRIGRTAKHVNQVFRGKAGTGELDYWAFVLGARFVVTLEALDAE